jgi:hypothetical protein
MKINKIKNQFLALQKKKWISQSNKLKGRENKHEFHVSALKV